MDAQDFPWREPSLTRIERLKLLIPALTRLAKEDLLEHVGEVQSSAETELRKVVSKSPRAIAGAVVEAVAQVAEQLAEDGTWEAAGLKKALKKSDARALKAAANDLRLESSDPRNAEEAVQALQAAETFIDQSPLLKKAGRAAVDELEQRGILGEGLLASVVEWMAVAGALGAFTAKVVEGQLYLVAGPMVLSANTTGDFNLILERASSDWLGKNLRVQVQGKDGQFTKLSISVPYVLPVDRVRAVVRPELTLRPGGDPTLGLSGTVKKDVGRGSVSFSPYARVGPGKGLVEKETGQATSREAGARLTVRFGAWGDDTVEPHGRMERTGRDEQWAGAVAAGALLVAGLLS